MRLVSKSRQDFGGDYRYGVNCGGRDMFYRTVLGVHRRRRIFQRHSAELPDTFYARTCRQRFARADYVRCREVRAATDKKFFPQTWKAASSVDCRNAPRRLSAQMPEVIPARESLAYVDVERTVYRRVNRNDKLQNL